jgi:diguanylate cyclase (GGDEF)-like protein
MKKKLIFLFIAVVCFPIILSVVLISNLVSDRMDTLLGRRAQSSMTVASNVFDQFIDDISLKARIISQLKDIKNAIIENDQIELIKNINFIRTDLNINFYDGIVEIYDKKGQLLVAEPKISKKMTADNIIRDALNGEVKTYSSLDGQKLKITSVYPLYHDSSAAPSGLVSVSFFISDKLADEIKKITNTEIIIFTSGSSPGKYLVLASSFIIKGKRMNLPENDIIINKDLKIDGKRYLNQYTLKEIDNGELYLAAAVEKSDVINIIISMQKWLYFIGFLAIAFALFIALFFSQRIISPINRLVTGVQKVGMGNLEDELLIKSGDEFQFLADSFDAMRLQIRDMIGRLHTTNILLDKKVSELSVINQINEVIIRESGDNLLTEILALIVNKMNVERSSIMLKDSHSDKLMLKFVSMRNDEQSKKIKQYVAFDRGEGFAGYVVENGLPVISNNPDSDPRFKKYDLADMNDEIHNIICVPLVDETDHSLGVINIVNRPGNFNEEDMNLLHSIAQQVAIALRNANLYELAITDGMTNLFIHRYFQARLETEVKRAERYNEKFALIMLDIDHFKKFNDTYGHPIGDIVIKRVAAIIKENTREDIDIVARYGGEEFAVILPETELEGAHLLAERFRKTVEETIIYHDHLELKVTISVGCAEFPTHSNSKEGLLAKSDAALYKSKERGRNKVTIAESNLQRNI